MKSFTNKRPKCLAKVKGKRLINWQLEAIRESQIHKIAIATGYLREQLINFSLDEFYNKNWAKTQMAASLFCAKEWFKDSELLISYSDIFYEKNAIEILKNCDQDISITFDPNWRNLWEKRFDNPLSDAESFKLDKNNKLIEVGNKSESVESIQGQYMGLIKTSKKGSHYLIQLYESLSRIEQEKLDMTSLLRMVIKEKKYNIHAYPYLGLWGEVDHQSDLDLYNKRI